MSAAFEWFGDGASINPVQINSYRSLLRRNGEIGTVVAVRIDDGLVTELYSVRNPEELSKRETGGAMSHSSALYVSAGWAQPR